MYYVLYTVQALVSEADNPPVGAAQHIHSTFCGHLQGGVCLYILHIIMPCYTMLCHLTPHHTSCTIKSIHTCNKGIRFLFSYAGLVKDTSKVRVYLCVQICIHIVTCTYMHKVRVYVWALYRHQVFSRRWSCRARWNDAPHYAVLCCAMLCCTTAILYYTTLHHPI